jgi:hypothetical protein
MRQNITNAKNLTLVTGLRCYDIREASEVLGVSEVYPYDPLKNVK